MATAVIMPRQGQSVETCIIGEWLKKKGDAVKAGDVLCTYETDKASFELTAEAEGILLEIFYQAGDEVPVLSTIAVIGQPGENVESFRASIPGEEKSAQESKKTEEKSPSSPAGEKDTPSPSVPSIAEGATISPRARKIAEQLGIVWQTIKGSGPSGRIIEKDVLEASETQPRMTPLARQIAEETGKIPVSTQGPGGMALHTDLGDAVYPASDEFEDKKLSNIRRLIARAMHESLQQSAQLTHHMSADVRKLLAFRQECKKAMEQGNSNANITINDMICFCVIKALKTMPEVNAHFLGDVQRFLKKVHLGIAVDTPRGLMVPVVRNAGNLSLLQLSIQIKNLADACRKGSIDPALIQSTAATFTVTNLGNYGVEMFTPVLNLPQVAILGVNTIIHRPADTGNGVWGFVPFIGLSLTYDHRALDGGPATLFLREIKNNIENWNEKIE